MFLDSKASAPAKAAITSWMDGEKYSGFDAKAAVLTSFNSIYGQRLFSVRAFLRSAALSICAVFIYLLMMIGAGQISTFFVAYLTVLALPIIMADFISLFAVS
jgi:hypothetical protein